MILTLFERSRNLSRSLWLWEALAGTFSLVCLATIIIVFLYENGKELDQWNLGFSPNVVVSFIAIQAKASIVLVLSQVLSQLKWYHLHEHPTAIIQLLDLDWASRGPLGSIRLILTSRRWLASCAAGLTLGALLIDPFMQLSLTFPSMLVQDGNQNSIFLRAQSWGIPGSKDQAHFEDIVLGSYINSGAPTDIVASMVTGARAGALPPPAVTCPSGNCTWIEPISTLGICAACNELTEPLISHCSNPTVEAIVSGFNPNYTYCDYQFPSGPSVGVWAAQSCNGSSTTPDSPDCRLTWTIWNSSQSFVVPNLKTPAVLANFNGLQLTPPTNASLPVPSPSPFFCELHWCERTSSVSVVNGVTVSSDLSEELLYWWTSQDDQIQLVTKSAMTSQPSKSSIYSVDALSIADLIGYFVTMFSVSYADPIISLLSIEANTNVSKLREAGTLQGIANHDFVSFPLGAHLGELFANSQDINQTLSKLASSMTEAIRTKSSATPVFGQTLVSKPFIHVQWVWLSLPVAVTLLTCILLLVVALRCRQKDVPVWKDSLLPLIFSRFDGPDYDLLADEKRDNLFDLENIAQAMHIRMSTKKAFTFERAYSVPIKPPSNHNV